MMKRFVLLFLFLTLGAVGSLHADENVRALQRRLKAGGFYFGEINGRYDSDTAAAVTRYQIGTASRLPASSMRQLVMRWA
jgi:hypothetical protein